MDAQDAAQGDFDFAGAEDAWARKSSAEREQIRGWMLRAERLSEAADLPGAVAIVDGDLPGGAIGLAVRNHSDEIPRLIVLSAGHVDDESLFTAVAALAWDEQRVPRASERRSVRAMADGRLIAEADGAQTSIPPMSPSFVGSNWFVSRLRPGARRISISDLAGIGRAEVITF